MGAREGLCRARQVTYSDEAHPGTASGSLASYVTGVSHFSWGRRMDPAVTRLLTTERLGRYVRAGGSDQAGWALYVWNSQMCSAYLEALSWVEVGLRNATADQMDQLRRSSDPKGEWLDPRSEWFSPWFQAGSVSNLRQARSQAQRGAAGVVAGRVIAELTFGFWVRLYSRHYEASLWTPALRHAFPAKMSRVAVHDQLLTLQRLRNRVAHHEPVFEQNHVENLGRIIETISWLDERFARAVEPELCFQEILARRP